LQRLPGQREGVPTPGAIVQLERRDRENVRRTRVEDECVFEPQFDDAPAFRPEPARAGDLVPIEALQRLGDLDPARTVGLVQILSITCLTTV
jgi:hypothetical protein